MKKIAHWVAFLLVIGVVFILLEGIWIFSPVKQRIREVVIRKVEQITGETVFFQDFSLSPFGVHFKTIEIASEKGRFSLHLDRLEVRFSLLKFVQNEFNPIGAVTGIRLLGPQLTVETKGTSAVPDRKMAPQKFAVLLQRLQMLPDIEYLEVENGEIYLREGRRRILLLQQLTGTLQSREGGFLWFNLKGSLLDDPRSGVRLIGNLQLSEATIQAQLHFENSGLYTTLPLLRHPNFQLLNARVNGVLSVNVPLNAPDSLQVSGDLYAYQVKGAIFNQQIWADSVHLQFAGDTLYFLPLKGKIADGQAHFSGYIAPLVRPRANWKLVIQGYSLKYLKRSHTIFDYLTEGKAEGQATFMGPLTNLTIEGQFRSKNLLYAVVPFHDNKVILRYHDKKLEFPFLQAYFKQLRTRGHGEIDFRSSQLQFQLSSDVKVPERLFHLLDRLNRKNIGIRWHFGGDFLQKSFTGRYHMAIGDSNQQLLELNGGLQLNDQHLIASGHSRGLKDTMRVYVEVKQLFSNPTFRIMDIKHFPLKQFTSSTEVQQWSKPYTINAYLAGPYNLLTASVLAYNRQTGAKVAQLNGRLKNIFQEEQKFDTRFWLATAPLPLKGKARLVLKTNAVFAHVELPGILQGELQYFRQQNNMLKGDLLLNEIQVGNYVKNDPHLSRLIQEGKLSGEIHLRGPLDNPTLSLMIDARDFIINGVGYYATRMVGELKNGRLTSREFWIQLNNSPVARARLTYQVFRDSLNMTIQGKQVESNFLVETLLGRTVPVRGTFDYVLHAVGHLKSPVIYGDVQIHHGEFEDKKFDLITLIFSDSIRSNQSLLNLNAHQLTIHKFLYVNKEEYTIEAEGQLGLGENDSLDIQLAVNGNVLLELSRVLPFFRNPRSNGVFKLHIGGSRGSPEIRSASLKIFNAAMSFESVLPPLTLLQADLVLPEGSRFIEIRRLEAWFGKRHAQLTNLPSLTLNGQALEPLVIAPLDLSLGILQLETDAGGLQLAIPGLMEPGDYGFFAVTGKEKGERFTISGPLESPYVRGTVIMYNARVTYPFLPTETSEENPVAEYLMNVNWDIRALSGKGNRYFVEIPAVIGKVSLDLAIDNAVSALEFRGRLSDESFRVVGQVESSNGRVEYLDTRFYVEKFGAEFHEFELFPEVYGRAYTTVRDSANAFPEDIYLVLYAVDPVTGKEVASANWENLRFKLESQNKELGETQESVLAKLGYSPQNVPRKAEQVGLQLTENILIRPLVRPLERSLEQVFRLDYVRLRSNFTGNLYYMTLGRNPYFNTQQPFASPTFSQSIDPVLLLLQSSELTVGKYLWRNFYISYSGQLVIPFYQDRLGFNHRFGLEYRIKRNLLLEIQYDKYLISPYYFQPGLLQDFSIRLRHSIKF